MSNHIHLIWQIQNGYERDAIQRNFLKFVSQTIKRDLEKNHPKVLQKFYVGVKDRKYQFWERNPLSIDLWTKEVFKQKLEYIHYNPVAAGLCVYPTAIWHLKNARSHRLPCAETLNNKRGAVLSL